MLLSLLVLICTLLPQNWAIDYKDYCIIKVKTTHINKLNEIVKSSTNCQHLDEDMANHEDCVTLLCTNSDVKNLEKHAFRLNLTIEVMEANVHEAMNNQMIENLVSMRSLKTHKFLSTYLNTQCEVYGILLSTQCVKNVIFYFCHPKKIRQINSLVFSLVKMLLSQNFCQRSVTVNSCNLHIYFSGTSNIPSM